MAFGFLGLGRAGETAGASIAQALKELLALQYRQQIAQQQAEAQRKFQEEMARQNFQNQLLLEYLRTGENLLGKYAQYLTPEQLASFTNVFGAGLTNQSVPDIANAVAELYKVGVQGASAARQEQVDQRVMNTVLKYAPSATPESVKLAEQLYARGDKNWWLPLGEGIAKNAQALREIENVLKQARAGYYQASAKRAEAEAKRIEALTPEQVKELQARAKSYLASAGLSEARSKEILDRLPYVIEHDKLSNDLLKQKVEWQGKQVELADLLIEKTRLANELAQETNPLKVQELRKRIADIDARTALAKAQKLLVEAQADITGKRAEQIDLHNEQMKKLFGAKLTDVVMSTAMKDADAGAALLESMRGDLEKAGVDVKGLTNTIERMRNLQKKGDPTYKGAYAAIQAAIGAPPADRAVWEAEAEKYKQQLIHAGEDPRVAEAWKQNLLNSWAQYTNEQYINLLKVQASLRSNSQGNPTEWYNLQLKAAEASRKAIKDAANTLADQINGKIKELNATGCVTLTGLLVQTNDTPECADAYKRVSQQVGGLVKLYSEYQKRLNDIGMYEAMLLQFPPGQMPLGKFLQQKEGERQARAASDELAQQLSSLATQSNGVVSIEEVQRIANEVAQKYGVGVDVDRIVQKLQERGVKVITPQERQRFLQEVYNVGP